MKNSYILTLAILSSLFKILCTKNVLFLIAVVTSNVAKEITGMSVDVY
jgi:hypothetical protein